MEEIILFAACLFSFAFDLTHVKPASALVFAYPLAVAAFAFRKRVNTDIFRKEKWIFVILAVLNLAVSLVVHNAPFVFIIFVSVLVFHIFYRFYFSSPIAKTVSSCFHA